MSKMRKNDDSEYLTPYLVCLKKRNKPRVHHSVCEERCSKSKNCVYYRTWLRHNTDGPSLEQPAKVKKPKKVVRKKRETKKRKGVTK